MLWCFVSAWWRSDGRKCCFQILIHKMRKLWAVFFFFVPLMANWLAYKRRTNRHHQLHWCRKIRAHWRNKQAALLSRASRAEEHSADDLSSLSLIHINLAGASGGCGRVGPAMAVLQGRVLWVHCERVWAGWDGGVCVWVCACACVLTIKPHLWMDSISGLAEWIKETVWFINCSSHSQPKQSKHIDWIVSKCHGSHCAIPGIVAPSDFIKRKPFHKRLTMRSFKQLNDW